MYFARPSQYPFFFGNALFFFRNRCFFPEMSTFFSWCSKAQCRCLCWQSCRKDDLFFVDASGKVDCFLTARCKNQLVRWRGRIATPSGDFSATCKKVDHFLRRRLHRREGWAFIMVQRWRNNQPLQRRQLNIAIETKAPRINRRHKNINMWQKQQQPTGHDPKKQTAAKKRNS